MVTIITKENCPNCSKLKMFIQHALNDTQKAKIQMVLKEDDETVYRELVEKYNILTLPAVIHNEITYPDILPSKLVELINKN